jgi:hypothetical protein
MLANIKTYADFPKNEEWIDRTLRKILTAPVGGNAVTAAASR